MLKEFVNTSRNLKELFKGNDFEFMNILEDNIKEIHPSSEDSAKLIEKDSDNPCLIVSEQENRVFLPYTVTEINNYLEQFPDNYSNFQDVVEKEFVLPLEHYTKNPVAARFRETYSLIRDREAKSVIEALKYSFDVMFRNDLNPTIIAACKTQKQLDDYIDCLERQNLENFRHFKIQFKVNPLAVKV